LPRFAMSISRRATSAGSLLSKPAARCAQ